MRAGKKSPESIEFYEGLVRKTAGRYSRIVQEEYEDLCQILRLKVWRALESFDLEKATQPIQGYVFSCVRNQVKDLLKRKRRDDLHIEDIAPQTPAGESEYARRDKFESRYLEHGEEEAFAEVLAETPLIPSTLSPNERRVVVCMYLEYGQAEIAEVLSLSRREVARSVRGIKDKMEDWKPSADDPPKADSTAEDTATAI